MDVKHLETVIRRAVDKYGRWNRSEAESIAWIACLEHPELDPYETACTAVRRARNDHISECRRGGGCEELTFADWQQSQHTQDGDYVGADASLADVDVSQLPPYLQRAMCKLAEGDAVDPSIKTLLVQWCRAIVNGDAAWIAEYRAKRRQHAAAYYRAHAEQCKAAARQRRAADPDGYRERGRAQYAAHREALLAYQAAYQATHREALLAYHRAWYAAHKAEELAKQRERRRAPERKAQQHAYYIAHRDEILARAKKRRQAQKGGLDGNQ